MEELRRRADEAERRADAAVKRAGVMESKLRQSREYISLNSRNQAAKPRGGNGRGSIVRRQSMGSGLAKQVTHAFMLHVLIAFNSVFPDGWRIASDSPASACWTILSLMGYCGPKKCKTIPDSCNGDLITLWRAIFGCLNTARQDYANALQKRFIKKMTCELVDNCCECTGSTISPLTYLRHNTAMLKIEKTIDSEAAIGRRPPPGTSLKTFKDHLELLIDLFWSGGIERILSLFRSGDVKDISVHTSFVEFLVVFGPKCLPETLSKQATTKLNEGNESVLDLVGQGEAKCRSMFEQYSC